MAAGMTGEHLAQLLAILPSRTFLRLLLHCLLYLPVEAHCFNGITNLYLCFLRLLNCTSYICII
jgi:hypothetical protein